MAFITGVMLIDAPASALNNGQGDETTARVKSVRVPGLGNFPYVSAQSFRYWLRESMHRVHPELPASTVYTAGAGKKQQAFTEGDPIKYWDDDLLGYMRAEKAETVTRVSPLRTSTVMSIAPVEIAEDFGVMARVKKQEGDKEGVLLHGHEFYRTTLQLLFSLDLSRTGTFTDVRRTGFQNLGQATLKAAKERNLPYDERYSGYRLPVEERIPRVQALLHALGRIEGGAKQTLHYTDVAPAFVMATVTKGGNHLLGRVVRADDRSQPQIHEGALKQAQTVFADDILSPIYLGRAEGFMDGSVATLAQIGDASLHPRQALDQLAERLAKHPEWFD